jgi:murein L,D-transpeptidase YcbB/YkuD
MARDVVLSDAMMGYLQFISGIPVRATAGCTAKAVQDGDPPLSVINQWQLALDNGSAAFIAGLAPRIRSMPMHQSLLALVADSRPWPQMTGSGAASGEWSNDIGAARDPPAYRYAGWRPKSRCPAMW